MASQRVRGARSYRLFFPKSCCLSSHLGSDEKNPLVNLREHFIKHAWQGRCGMRYGAGFPRCGKRGLLRAAVNAPGLFLKQRIILFLRSERWRTRRSIKGVVGRLTMRRRHPLQWVGAASRVDMLHLPREADAADHFSRSATGVRSSPPKWLAHGSTAPVSPCRFRPKSVLPTCHVLTGNSLLFTCRVTSHFTLHKAKRWLRPAEIFSVPEAYSGCWGQGPRNFDAPPP